jgi:hypothetical protein
MRLSPAVRLVIRIGSGLLVAAAIAVALTVPAPAFDEQCMIMAPSATSGYQSVYVRSWHLFAVGDFGGEHVVADSIEQRGRGPRLILACRQLDAASQCTPCFAKNPCRAQADWCGNLWTAPGCHK